MPPYKRNILCIEGRWVKDLTKHNSVGAGLDLLQKNNIIGKQRCLLSRSASDTLNLLTEFTQKRYSSFSIIYLSFHGSPGSIGWGKEAVLLSEIQDKLADKLQGKILHFGSCRTLKQNKRILNNFLRITGAEAISGFTEDVPFMESTLFDLLFFERCQYSQELQEVATCMKTDYGQLSKRLGFRFVTQE